MNSLNKFIQSLDSKVSIGYALVRIFLGLALAIRGWLIISNPESIMDLGVEREYFFYISIIGFVHLIGGLLLFFGFFSRIGALIQIPILFSAIFFVYDYTKLMMGGQSLELAVLVLFLLCIYFIYGPGTLSLRSYFANKKLNF